MVESMVEWLIGRLDAMVSGEWIVFIVSMLPVVELRGGILAGYALGLDWWRTFRTAVIGNVLPVPLILLLVRPVFAYLKKTRFLAPWVRRIEERSMRKSGQIKKFRALGLCLFVAVPLPGTGAWTGSLIAVLLDMRMRDAAPAIGLGVLVAGFIMSALSYGLLERFITGW